MSSHRCGTCRDVRWVAVEVPRNVVKPCPACNQATYGRWAGGEYHPDFVVRRDRQEPDVVAAADGLAACRDELAGRRAKKMQEAKS